MKHRGFGGNRIDDTTSPGDANNCDYEYIDEPSEFSLHDAVPQVLARKVENAPVSTTSVHCGKPTNAQAASSDRIDSGERVAEG
jgi:hypothetical protein